MAENQEPTQLDRIEKTLDVLARHLEPLPDKVDAVERKVDRVDGKVDGVDKRLTAFQAETEANFVEVHDHVDTLKTTVRRQGDELAGRRKAA